MISSMSTKLPFGMVTPRRLRVTPSACEKEKNGNTVRGTTSVGVHRSADLGANGLWGMASVLNCII